MPDTTSLLLFLAAGLALNFTPGPDMLYVMTRSSAEGTRAGVVSAFGISVGSLVHLAAVVLGLASLLEAVPIAYDVVRYAGAAYLIYLGVRTLIGTRSTSLTTAGPRASLGRIFRQGVVTNILNPKVALFFAAFLPQFARPENGPVVAQLVVLGLLFNCTGTLVNLLVAYASGRAGTHMRERLASSRILPRVTASIFIALGLRLALQSRP